MSASVLPWRGDVRVAKSKLRYGIARFYTNIGLVETGKLKTTFGAGKMIASPLPDLRQQPIGRLWGRDHSLSNPDPLEAAPILETNVALDRSRNASRWFAPPAVPERKTCWPSGFDQPRSERCSR